MKKKIQETEVYKKYIQLMSYGFDCTIEKSVNLLYSPKEYVALFVNNPKQLLTLSLHSGNFEIILCKMHNTDRVYEVRMPVHNLDWAEQIDFEEFNPPALLPDKNA